MKRNTHSRWVYSYIEYTLQYTAFHFLYILYRQCNAVYLYRVYFLVYCIAMSIQYVYCRNFRSFDKDQEYFRVFSLSFQKVFFSGFQESMKMMGLDNWLHWSAWFTKSLMFFIATSLLVTLLLCTRWLVFVFLKSFSDWLPVWAFLWRAIKGTLTP